MKVASLAWLSVGLLLVQPVVAAEADSATLKAQIEKLSNRIEQLEQTQKNIEEAMDDPYISALEPEVAARLKAVESQANRQKKAAQIGDSLDGIAVGASFTMVNQQAVDGGDNHVGELNYRADVEVSVPMSSLGNSSSSELYGQFRMGQGEGLGTIGSAFSSTNATTFQRPNTDSSDSTVLLAQAWYGVQLPLPLGGNPGLARERLEFNIGKIDPFAFFDGNNIADDETSTFMNQALVHNPLLDVGGDVGVDDFGFSPGLRLAYVNERQAPESYTASVGVFGAGKGAGFTQTLSSPMVMVQLETQQRFYGMAGQYRLYGWSNGRGENYDEEIKRHSGVGLSFDQQVHDYTRVFLRLGQQLQGKVRFDQTVTLGMEVGGSYWNRGADALGLAGGLMSIASDFKRDSLTLDVDVDGEADYGYQASGSEQVYELYYRYFFNDQLTLTPSLQWVSQAGGDRHADEITVLGVRAQLNY